MIDSRSTQLGISIALSSREDVDGLVREERIEEIIALRTVRGGRRATHVFPNTQ